MSDYVRCPYEDIQTCCDCNPTVAFTATWNRMQDSVAKGCIFHPSPFAYKPIPNHFSHISIGIIRRYLSLATHLAPCTELAPIIFLFHGTCHPLSSFELKQRKRCVEASTNHLPICNSGFPSSDRGFLSSCTIIMIKFWRQTCTRTLLIILTNYSLQRNYQFCW